MAEVKDEEIVVGEDELICALTGVKKKASEKELNLQSVILQMNEEYKFDMKDMQRDFSFKWQDNEEDKTRTSKVDLAIFQAGKARERENDPYYWTKIFNLQPAVNSTKKSCFPNRSAIPRRLENNSLQRQM